MPQRWFFSMFMHFLQMKVNVAYYLVISNLMLDCRDVVCCLGLTSILGRPFSPCSSKSEPILGWGFFSGPALFLCAIQTLSRWFTWVSFPLSSNRRYLQSAPSVFLFSHLWELEVFFFCFFFLPFPFLWWVICTLGASCLLPLSQKSKKFFHRRKDFVRVFTVEMVSPFFKGCTSDGHLFWWWWGALTPIFLLSVWKTGPWGRCQK